MLDIGRVTRGDCVLIHNGASPLGQAARQILSDTGVGEVWTTANGMDEIEWLSNQIGAREDRIIPQVWFESQSMVLSQLEPKFLAPCALARVSVITASSDGLHENWRSLHILAQVLRHRTTLSGSIAPVLVVR